MRTTLQNRKKCPSTKPTMNPHHQTAVASANAAVTPTARMITSSTDSRKPGAKACFAFLLNTGLSFTGMSMAAHATKGC
jgi:hypothetical protein